jgi:hypothetical protein
MDGLGGISLTPGLRVLRNAIDQAGAIIWNSI